MRADDEPVRARRLKLFVVFEADAAVDAYRQIREFFLDLFYSRESPLVERISLVADFFNRHQMDEVHIVEKRENILERFIKFDSQTNFRIVSTLENTLINLVNDHSLGSPFYPFAGYLFGALYHEMRFEVFVYIGPNVFLKN